MAKMITVQIVGLVRVMKGVYANDTSLVTNTSSDALHYTIHVCKPLWIEDQNSGLEVTSYTYADISGTRTKHTLHPVADIGIYSVLNGSRFYCSQLSRVNGEKKTDSIKHTLTLYPSLHIAPNISCPDIIRTEKHCRVTWRTGDNGIFTHDQQRVLETASKLLYTDKRTHRPTADMTPQPLDKDIHLGMCDPTTFNWLSTTSHVVVRVAHMLFVCDKKCASDHQDATHEQGLTNMPFINEEIYFPCRGGRFDALQRVRTMLQSLHSKIDQTVDNTPLLFSPLTTCGICADKSIVLHRNESDLGVIFSHPIPLMPACGTVCSHQQPGPLHLFSIPLEDAAWLEREILCGHEHHNVEALSQRIEKSLQIVSGIHNRV